MAYHKLVIRFFLFFLIIKLVIHFGEKKINEIDVRKLIFILGFTHITNKLLIKNHFYKNPKKEKESENFGEGCIIWGPPSPIKFLTRSTFYPVCGGRMFGRLFFYHYTNFKQFSLLFTWNRVPSHNSENFLCFFH
jgi:hypothetical protein